MRDGVLLELLRTDPDKGMRVLIDLYGGLVYAVIRSKLSGFCAADIEEVVADTFSEFYCDLDRFDLDRGSVRAWLCVIARHNAFDRLRRHGKQAGEVSLDDGVGECPADGMSVEDEIETHALRAALVAAVKALGRPDSEIVIRKYFYGQPSKEIAAVLHMTVSAVDTRAHRAVAKLRKQLGEEQL